MNMNFFCDIYSIPHSIVNINEQLIVELRNGLKQLNYLDIPPGYAPIFRILDHNGGKMTASKLSEKSHKSKPYITQALNALEKSGYITKHADSNDKRIHHVFLTEKGWEAEKAIADLIENIVHTHFSNFSVEELQILALLLNKSSLLFSHPLNEQ